MAISTHPQYDDNKDEWQELIDVANGPTAVKARGAYFLPPSRGMIIDGFGTDIKSEGHAAYEAYVKRANFPGNFSECIKKTLGVLHKKKAQITLPDSMKSLYENANGAGESIYELHRRINKRQLISGRVGILGDMVPIEPGSNKMRPILSLYNEMTIPQWVTDNNKTFLVILDESSPQFDWDEMKYKDVKQFRIIKLQVNETTGRQEYVTATTNDESADLNALDYYAPSVFGVTLDELPFSFCNAGDTSADVSEPPLQGLKDCILGIYRASADLSSALFQQASETLVITGRSFSDDDDEHVRTGTGAVINLPANATAQFIGPQSQGIPEMRLNMQNLFDLANAQSNQLSVQSKSSRDSAESLALRGSSMSQAYANIALTGAEALQQTLRSLAPYFGANPQEIKVVCNLDFALPSLDAKSLVELQTAKNTGLKISDRSIHDLLISRGVTTKSFEDEQKLLAAEESLLDL